MCQGEGCKLYVLKESTKHIYRKELPRGAERVCGDEKNFMEERY